MSFADMMTLLFCLFMVLFAISSVNTSKFEALQKALQDAFSGKILSGGEAVMETGNDKQPEKPRHRAAAAVDDAAPGDGRAARSDERAEEAKPPSEDQDFKTLKRARSTRWSRRRVCTGKVETTVRKRGLVVQLLTDKVFFDSGQADAQAAGAPSLLDKIGDVLSDERRTRSSSRATPTRSRSPARSVPVQLGALRRPRVGGRPRLRRTTASRAAGCLRRAATAPRTRSPPTRPPKGARATGAST